MCSFQVDAKIVPVPDYAAALRELLENRADVLFGDRALVIGAMSEEAQERLVILDRMFTHDALALALPRGDEDVAAGPVRVGGVAAHEVGAAFLHGRPQRDRRISATSWWGGDDRDRRRRRKRNRRRSCDAAPTGRLPARVPRGQPGTSTMMVVVFQVTMREGQGGRYFDLAAELFVARVRVHRQPP